MYYNLVVSNNFNNYIVAVTAIGHGICFLTNKLRNLLKFYSKQKLIYTLKTVVLA